MHFLNSAYPNITKDPIYLDEISEETLEIAAKIYFRTIFCPDFKAIVMKKDPVRKSKLWVLFAMELLNS